MPAQAQRGTPGKLSAGGFAIGSPQHKRDLRRVRTERGTQAGMAGETPQSAAKYGRGTGLAPNRPQGQPAQAQQGQQTQGQRQQAIHQQQAQQQGIALPPQQQGQQQAAMQNMLGMQTDRYQPNQPPNQQRPGPQWGSSYGDQMQGILGQAQVGGNMYGSPQWGSPYGDQMQQQEAMWRMQQQYQQPQFMNWWEQ